MAADAPEKEFEKEIISVEDLPTDQEWRVVVLLVPGQKIGLVGEFGHDLAKSHKGELIFGCVVTDADASQLESARETLRAAHKAAVADQFDVAYLVVIQIPASRIAKQLRKIVERSNFDLVITRADSYLATNISDLPADIAIFRGPLDQLDQAPADSHIQKILVPTSGGPNTEAAFNLLKPLCDDREVTALYIAVNNMGSRERAHGYNVLRKVVQLAEVERIVDRKVVSSDNAAEGIMEVASGDFDLVVLGANEDSLDRFLFGDVVGRVVRESHKSVLVYRRRRLIGSTLVSQIDWRLRQLLPHLNEDKRHETYSRIRANSRAEISFYVLIALSAAIASFGLLQNSPAVVIGAMLVAPLMSPIVGVGMAMVLGEVRFLQMAVKSVARGVGLSLLVGCLVGLFWINAEALPLEVTNRTAPNLFDLGVAIFSGMAAAYALSYSQAAGALPGVAIAAALVPPISAAGICLITGNFDLAWGALVLFGTNFISVINASALVFFILGFRPSSSDKAEKTYRQTTFQIAFTLFLVNAAVLGYWTYDIFQERALQRVITEVVVESIEVMDTENQRITISHFEDPVLENREGSKDIVDLQLTVRSERQLFESEAERLRELINEELEKREMPFKAELDLTVILVAIPDPIEETISGDP